MSAAFDTVVHDILLSDLQSHGITGSALEWFRSYLSGRTQTILIGDSRSASEEVSCGVPQGSVLGPLLFTMYSSGLADVIKQHVSGFHFYADDIQIYMETEPENLQNAIRAMENCIIAVHDWLCAHQLKLNENKTEFLIFTPKHMHMDLSDVTLRSGNHEIKAKNHVIVQFPMYQKGPPAQF